MPTNGDPPDLLIDTSVAVALVVAGHEHHQETRKAIGDRRCGLSGHAAFETFSVLTRMPPPNRRTPQAVARLLAHNFPAPRFLSAEGAERLNSRLAELGIAGGAVYDALVAAAAAEHGITLATRDARAAETYRALEADFELIVGGTGMRAAPGNAQLRCPSS
jgi:predicted nucleic acid-binding protein